MEIPIFMNNLLAKDEFIKGMEFSTESPTDFISIKIDFGGVLLIIAVVLVVFFIVFRKRLFF